MKVWAYCLRVEELVEEQHFCLICDNVTDGWMVYGVKLLFQQYNYVLKIFENTQNQECLLI